jgi:hypothetical protein
MSSNLGEEWETVHTVNLFYDFPRVGVADFQGRPHAFRPVWDEEADDYSTIYELSPLEPEQFKAVLEDWQIWLRWSTASRKNALGPLDTHPALAIDKNRSEELKATVDQALTINPSSARRAIPTFWPELDETYRVKWEEVD